MLRLGRVFIEFKNVGCVEAGEGFSIILGMLRLDVEAGKGFYRI